LKLANKAVADEVVDDTAIALDRGHHRAEIGVEDAGDIGRLQRLG